MTHKNKLFSSVNPSDQCISKVLFHPKNERIKRKYFEYVSEVSGKSFQTQNLIRKSLHRFEEYTKHKDFSTFNKDQAIGFKKHLRQEKTFRTKEPLSESTILATLKALQEFFKWLSCMPRYKSRIHRPEIEYLNLSLKERNAAKARKYKPFPSIEQINHVINTMPIETEVQRCNRALIAFILLTGIRDGTLISLKIKDVNLENELVAQNPREVSTKFSKQINTFFFPVGEHIKKIVADWIHELKTIKLFDSSAPLFPRTQLVQDENNSFQAGLLEPIHWQSSVQVRKIFKEAFENAGLNYYSPHLLRKTITELGERICTTPEEFKAWSQNLGHESPLTTFTSYGTLSVENQRRVIKGLRERTPN